MAARDDYILEQLVELGYLTTEQVQNAQAEAAAAGTGAVDWLLEKKVVDHAAVTVAKGAHFGVEVVSLADLKLDDEVIAAVPRHIAKRYRVVPVYKHGNHLGLALSDPSDLDTIDTLHHLLKMELELKVASEPEIEAALNKYYGAAEDSVSKMIQDITEGEVQLHTLASVGDADDGGRVEADAPIIKLVNTLIVEAFRSRASDIHLEPLGKTLRVRCRIDDT